MGNLQGRKVVRQAQKWLLGLGFPTPIMENQMENEMEARVI